MHNDHSMHCNRLRHRLLPWIVVPLLLQLAACGAGSNKDDLTADRNGLDDPDRFLEYFDPQADLSGGPYEVTASRPVAATGTVQEFTLRIDLATGAYIQRNGRWNAGEDSVTYSFDLEEFGGATIQLSSSADNILTLTHADTSAQVSMVDDGAAGVTEKLVFLRSEVDSSTYARAYYDAVDPLNERRTLAAWKEASGFNDCNVAIIEVKFRDTKDLGYGRHMRACTDTPPNNGYAYFVDNYQVDPIPEIAYSALNLDAVLKEDIDWNIGTNAIEFSLPQNAAGAPIAGPMIAKFFTFEPRSAGTEGQRDLRLQADLDSRGNKAMPMICVQCHGGRLLPLNPDSTFPRLRTDDNLGVPGGVEAKLQALEVDTFDFPDSGPYSRANQEENLRKINESVYLSYSQGDYDDSGEWDSRFVAGLLDGWYGGDGDDSNGAEGVVQSGAVFDQSFVPDGWQPDPVTGTPPVGADDLFREVISPRCIVCHGKRGSTLQMEIQFSTYEDFIDHADQLEELIFDEGLMPAARVEFEAMWEGGQSDDQASLIGSFLPDFSHGNADGSVDKPGSAHADAGPDRTVSGLPATISGEDSFFADSYQWTLISSPTAGATLTNTSSARATLAGTADGDYVVRLTVRDSGGGQESDTVTITVDSGMSIPGLVGTVPLPREIRFQTSGVITIRDILQNGAGGDVCTNCHVNGGGYPGIPMWWTNGTDQSTTGKDTADLPSLYDRAMVRVNLRDPNTSLILRKPSGNHHGGLLIAGFDLSGAPTDHLAYDMFYTWIVEGAPQ